MQLGDEEASPPRRDATSAQVATKSGPWSCRGCLHCLVAGFGFVLLAAAIVVSTALTWDSDYNKKLFQVEKELADGKILIEDYDAGKWFFLIIMCIIFLINLLVVIPVFTIFFRRRCKIVPEKVESVRNLPDPPGISAIIPCYLPNEQSIIMESAMHVLENVESPGEMTLWVVYNTPKEIPEIEQQLQDLAARSGLPGDRGLPRGRTLKVMRVHGSKSKAENLNACLDLIDHKYVVIYDADHHPDANSLMLIFEKLVRKGMDCVQGSTYIRNLEYGIVGRIIDAEFFITHFMYFPALKLLVRQGLFGGSNAIWVKDVLIGKQFCHKMQTEDIDLSIRSLIDRRNIDFCPEARSGELAPVNLKALYKQRLRWCIGWDQVSLKYFKGIMTGSNEGQSRRERWALFHVLYVRWFAQLCGLIAGVLAPILGLIWRFEPAVWGTAITLVNQTLFYCFLLNIFCTVTEAICQTHHRGCRSWGQVFFVTCFMVFGSLYVLTLTTLLGISLLKIATGTVGGWVVTARTKDSNLQTPEEACAEGAGGATELENGGRVRAASSQSTSSTTGANRNWSGVDEAFPSFGFDDSGGQEDDVPSKPPPSTIQLASTPEDVIAEVAAQSPAKPITPAKSGGNSPLASAIGKLRDRSWSGSKSNNSSEKKGFTDSMDCGDEDGTKASL